MAKAEKTSPPPAINTKSDLIAYVDKQKGEDAKKAGDESLAKTYLEETGRVTKAGYVAGGRKGPSPS